MDKKSVRIHIANAQVCVDDGADIIGHDDGQVSISSIDRNSGVLLPVTVQLMVVGSTIISSVRVIGA